MKLTIFLLTLVPFVITGPNGPMRQYFPEEEDPDFKRYIYINNSNGEIEMVDLREGENKIAPRVGVSDVEYDLYTKSNQVYPYIITSNSVDELQLSYFDPKKKSVFVAHGWHSNRNSAVNTEIRQAIFANNDVNLFIIDWSGPANKLYLSAKNSVVPVGQVVGNFINAVQATYGLDGSSFVLIGHSLGAHVVGSAGATVTKQVANIIGLDPAGPLFSLNYPENRLDISDGKLVQVIHTNGNLLGFASSIGHIDYFPNGGMTQPGCGWDLTGTCSHSKAYKYMAEALNRGSSVFESRLCTDWKQFLAGKCGNNQPALMGDIHLNTGTFGDYFLETGHDEPFGLS